MAAKKIKKILGNGLPYALVFSGLSIALGYLFHLSNQDVFVVAALMGLAALTVNGLMYGRFSKPAKELEHITINPSGQELLIQAPANHMIDDSLVPGKLFLTKDYLLFKTYGGKSVEAQEYAWLRVQLEPIGFYKSVWNKGGEFLLKTNENRSLMFEVDEIKPWKEALRPV